MPDQPPSWLEDLVRNLPTLQEVVDSYFSRGPVNIPINKVKIYGLPAGIVFFGAFGLLAGLIWITRSK